MNNSSFISPSDHDKSLKKPYNLVIGLFLATFNVGLVCTTFGIFFKPVSADFGWTRAETAGAFSLATIMSGIAGILAGKLGERFSLRLMLLICGILQGGAYLLLSQVSNLWQLYFFYGILVGCGMANIVPASTLVTRGFDKQRGRMTGLALSGAAFSSIFAPYLATWLIESYNWHFSYIVIGGLCIFITAVAMYFIYSSGDEKPSVEIKNSKFQKPESNKNKGLKTILGSWIFWCLALIYFCFHFSLAVVQVHIVPYATDLGISAVLAASIITIANGANVAGGFILGSINDKIGGLKSLILGLIVLLTGSLLLLVSNSFWLLFFFAVVFGLAWGGVGSIRSVIVAELFGLSSHGVLVGAILVIALVGGTLSPVITGYIFDTTGQYQMAFVLLTGLVGIGLILSLFLARQGKLNKN